MANSWISPAAQPGPWSTINCRMFMSAAEPSTSRAWNLFAGREGIAEVLVGRRFGAVRIESRAVRDKSCSFSAPNSWQAYYWWLDDSPRSDFRPNRDIHRKPGYDPVELHFDPATKAFRSMRR